MLKGWSTPRETCRGLTSSVHSMDISRVLCRPLWGATLPDTTAPVTRAGLW